MDDKDIFEASFEDEGAETQPEPQVEEPKVEEAPASEPEPPVAEPPPEGTTITVEAPKPEPGFVPFAAVLDERDKRKALEAEVAKYREQQVQQPQPELPTDPFDENFVPALTEKFQEALYQQSLQMSERFARQQYGDETTEAALAWARAKCDSDLYFNAQVKASGDPVSHAVREYQRDQIASQVTPDDFQQFIAWKQAQAGLQQQPAPTAQTAITPPQKPPKSLASAPSAGPATAAVIQTDDEIFEETFSKG
jgi:hypothetical protein